MMMRLSGRLHWPARRAGASAVVSARRGSAFAALWRGAGAGALGLGLPWVLLGPDLWEESEQLSQRQQRLTRERSEAQAKVQAWQAQLEPAGGPATAPAASELASGQMAAAGLMLHRLALRQGVRLEQLKSSGDGPAGAAGSSAPAGQAPIKANDATVRLQVRGPYAALVGFVQALGESTPMWSLRQLDLQAGPARAHRLSLVLQALPADHRTIASRPPARPDRAAVDPFAAAPVAIKATATAPASEPPAIVDPLADVPALWRPEFVRERQPLEALALRDLGFTGTLRQGSHWLALMRGRDAVHTVKVGDYLGPDLGRVQAIDEDGLDLRELRRDGSGRWAEHWRRWRVGGAP